MRLHSHLLTGRHQNAVLAEFAKEIMKKSKQLDGEFSPEIAEQFRVSRHAFNRAVKRVTGLLIKGVPSGILKKRLNMAQGSRGARYLNRTSQKHHEGLATAGFESGLSPIDREAMMAFTESDSHFFV